jgi:hypothetical protein
MVARLLAKLTPRRLTLAAATCTAGLLLAAPAQAADHTDAIPATVGPPGGIGFYFNPSVVGLNPAASAANAARVQAVVLRSLARWGDSYLGLTTAAPGTADGVNVIGVGPLDDGVLGLTQTRSTDATAPVAASQSCVPTAREPTSTAIRDDRTITAHLHRDSFVGRRLRHRVLKRKLKVPHYKLVTSPAIAQLCTFEAATSNTSATPEYDVTLSPDPVDDPWQLGPALPTTTQFDFETDALHELGHVSGLAHQVSLCDPSTPMPTSEAPAEFWHAVGDWKRPGCTPSVPPAPAPVVSNGVDSPEPLPGAGATALAGIGVYVNPRVPAGYDPGRFVGVATRAIQRAGGTPLGVTNNPPTSGDGVSVMGFAPLGVGVLTSATRVPRQQVLQPYAVASCRKKTVHVRRQVVIHKVKHQRGRRLRRDVVQTKTRSVSGFACTSSPRPAVTAAIASEVDLQVNQQTLAWEFGPKFPTDGTRTDLETALLQDVMSGTPEGTSCDTTTPNSSSGASPGDWWRSAAEVSRARCVSGATNTVATTTRKLRSGGGQTTVHRTGALGPDVQPLP